MLLDDFCRCVTGSFLAVELLCMTGKVIDGVVPLDNTGRGSTETIGFNDDQIVTANIQRREVEHCVWRADSEFSSDEVNFRLEPLEPCETVLCSHIVLTFTTFDSLTASISTRHTSAGLSPAEIMAEIAAKKSLLRSFVT